MTLQPEPQYKLRLSEELRDRLKESAKKYNRTMNADIVARLEASFAEDASTEKGAGINFQLDSEWFKKTGLTADEFARYVRLSILSGLNDNKKDG